jgi:hypothetical protein
MLELSLIGSACHSFVLSAARASLRAMLKCCIQSLNGVSLSVRRDFHRRFQIAIVFVVRPIWLFCSAGYPRHAFAPGCDTKSWCGLPRKGSRTRTETL